MCVCCMAIKRRKKQVQKVLWLRSVFTSAEIGLALWHARLRSGYLCCTPHIRQRSPVHGVACMCVGALHYDGTFYVWGFLSWWTKGECASATNNPPHLQLFWISYKTIVSGRNWIQWSTICVFFTSVGKAKVRLSAFSPTPAAHSHDLTAVRGLAGGRPIVSDKTWRKVEKTKKIVF